MAKSVLYINRKDKEKARKVLAVAIQQHVKMEKIEEGMLAGLPEDAELMKLRGFTGTELRSFLDALRAQGIRVDHKCVETEANRDWPLEKLYQEIKAEHEYMKNRQG